MNYFFMPTNLNALIRYKTIDRCLRNEYVKWTIGRLSEECTEALGEARGVYKKVSERTIRDDIRVMRSDILGFNAPIVFENGGYRYKNNFYTIFRAAITDTKLFETVFDLLIKNKDVIKHPRYYFVVEALASLVNKEMPDDILMPDDDGLEVKYSLAPKIQEVNQQDKADDYASSIDPDLKAFVDNILSKPESPEPEAETNQRFYLWKDILNII